MIMTDQHDEDILHNIQENIDRNFPEVDPSHLSCCSFMWGSSTDLLLEGNAQGYDVLLLADLIYFPDAHHSLLQSCKAMLKPSGVALVVVTFHPNTSKSEIMQFFELAKTDEFRYDVEHVQSWSMPPVCYWETEEESAPHLFRLTYSKR